MNAADSLNDLSAPSGNRLEALKGDRRGQRSILINDQWRMTPYRVAKDIGVTPIAITQITKGRRSVTAQTALLLAKYFGTSPEVWVRSQAQYDLEVEREKIGPRLEKVLPAAA